jgi:archaellum component FlaG (FlaF/FlaG flagellin family)
MFGYASFATPTFADLGSQLYIGDALENVTLADSSTGFGTFVSVILESITNADSITVLVSFVSSATENTGYADSAISLRTQFAVINEPQSIADAPLGFAWIKIDNTESTQWVLIDNRQ